ncbi:MAG: Auxin-responsive GH3-related protein [Comamonadaceae bacterium]|nr:MAG: Auxin-responsive GH3-related protein [Comamonadaceae bacterium]
MPDLNAAQNKPVSDDIAWLQAMLARNTHAAYLKAYGAPQDLAAFRQQVPLTSYEELQAQWLPRVLAGEPRVLFDGLPCAYERTGGSSGGAKLIPFSTWGLLDFQAAINPWLGSVVSTRNIMGLVYLATSPATRKSEHINGIPVGLPDGAYLGEQWGQWIAQRSAVPLALMAEPSVDVWREKTLASLRAAPDLEMISVWSPTFFLRLLDDLPAAENLWPKLKLISCWASAESSGAAAELQARLSHAQIQPKGLLSTECVVTVPDELDRPVLTHHGFFEFESPQGLFLRDKLTPGASYTVIATTASGLYRYRTGDMVLCKGYTDSKQPILEFQGRSGIASDLVGEKLTEAFVSEVLHGIRGFRFLAPIRQASCYVLVTDEDAVIDLTDIEARLCANPQYAYARALGQLKPLQHRPVRQLYDRYVSTQVDRGVRLADVKPVALIPNFSWID